MVIGYSIIGNGISAGERLYREKENARLGKVGVLEKQMAKRGIMTQNCPAG
jgi:hypothetical protein